MSLWADEPDSKVHHISLAEEADVIVIAPCTANVIAKLAHGRADDMLTTTVLATEAPSSWSPRDEHAHVAQGRHASATWRRSSRAARVIVEPGRGELACGDVGEGRLARADDDRRGGRGRGSTARAISRACTCS